MSMAEFERVEQGQFEGNQMAEKARMSSVGMREIVGIVSESRAALVITNQQRENISSGPMSFGPKKTTPGGSAPLYYASVRLETGRREQIKEGAGDDARVIGQYLSVCCRKSKVYSKFEGAKEIKLPYTARGIDFGMMMFETLMTVGGPQIISSAIELCGGENVFGKLTQMAPTVSVEAVLEADPEAIVATGMGDARPEWLDDWNKWPRIRIQLSSKIILMLLPRPSMALSVNFAHFYLRPAIPR